LKSFQITSKSGELLHYVESLLFDAQGLGSRFATKRFIKWIDSIKPDLVHLHNIHGCFLNYPILFKYFMEQHIPIIWTLHDCWPFTGHCVYFDRVGCEKWKTGCSNCPQTKEYPKSLMDKSKINFSSKKSSFASLPDLTIVPVSNWLSGLVGESYLSKYPRKVIHNGIDLSIFSPKDSIPVILLKNDIELSKNIVLGVADGFDKRKGVDDFVSLAKMLGESYQIVMVGVQNKIDVPGILALGRTKNQYELAELYSTASVFINPTYEDNFPTTNIEALACGTPVVTYKTGGSPEAINERTGLVVEKGNISELAHAIKTICERAVANFDMNERFMDYIQLYNQLIE